MPAAPEKTNPRSFHVLGVRVDAVQIPDTIAQMEEWIRERGCGHYIAVTGMHGITEARHDASFRRILKSADLVVPDGMPLVWLGRLRGLPVRRRVYGPELMMTFCQETASKGFRHFFSVEHQVFRKDSQKVFDDGYRHCKSRVRFRPPSAKLLPRKMKPPKR